jgi:hypothetical protein
MGLAEVNRSENDNSCSNPKVSFLSKAAITEIIYNNFICSKMLFFHNWKKRNLKFPNSMAYSHIVPTVFKLLNIKRFQVVGWEEIALF